MKPTHKKLLLDYCEKYDGSRINGAKRYTDDFRKKELGLRYCEALYDHAESVGALNILEIGFGWGFSAISFLASLSNRKGGQLVSVDPKPQTTTIQICKAAKELGVEYEFVQEKSRLYHPSGRYDLVYIDGDPFQALMDYERFEPFVRKGGLIVIDGYPDQKHPKMAVDAIGGCVPDWYSNTNAHAVFTHV
jgi:hypothetical protein